MFLLCVVSFYKQHQIVILLYLFTELYNLYRQLKLRFKRKIIPMLINTHFNNILSFTLSVRLFKKLILISF